MLKKCNRILAFLLALVLVITTFKSDFNGLRVFAGEKDEITVDATKTEETELPSIFEKVDETPAVTEDAVVTDSENQNDQVEEIVEENKEDESQAEVTEELAEEEIEEDAEEAETEEETEEDKEEVKEVAMDLPFFADTTIAEDGIKISLYAAENVLPNDAQLEVVKVESSLEEKIAETIDGETEEGLEVEKTYSYDINIKSESAGGYVQPEDGTVKVTFDNIVAAESEDTSLAVYHVETSGDEVTGVTEVPSNSEEATDVSIDAEHFSIYTITIRRRASGSVISFNVKLVKTNFVRDYWTEDFEGIGENTEVRLQADYYGTISNNDLLQFFNIPSGYKFIGFGTYRNLIKNFKLVEGRRGDKVQYTIDGYYYYDCNGTNIYAYCRPDVAVTTAHHLDIGFEAQDFYQYYNGNAKVYVQFGDEEPIRVYYNSEDRDIGTYEYRYNSRSAISADEEFKFIVEYKGKKYVKECDLATNNEAFERCFTKHLYNQNDFGFDYVVKFTEEFIEDKTVPVAVYATDGTGNTTVNDSLKSALGLNYVQLDGYYPIGVTYLPESMFKGSSPYIHSQEDLDAIRAALVNNIKTSYLKGAAAANQGNSVAANLDKVMFDKDQINGSNCTALFKWEQPEYVSGGNGSSISLIDGKYYKYHLDLRFDTTDIEYYGAYFINDELDSVDENSIYKETFLKGSSITVTTFDKIDEVEDYDIEGFYTSSDCNANSKVEPGTQTDSTAIYVKFVKHDDTAKYTVEYYKGTTLVEEDTDTTGTGNIGDAVALEIDENKYLEDNFEYKEVKYFSRENGVDTELTGLDKNKILAGDKLVVKVLYVEHSATSDVYFFIISDAHHTPDGWAQKSEFYIPEGGNQTGLKWPGTATNIDDLIKIADELQDSGKCNYYEEKTGKYFAFYNWTNGIQSLANYQFKPDVKDDIDKEVSKYTNTTDAAADEKFTEEDVLWYVYKRQNAGPLHIDGYIRSYITYYPGYKTTQQPYQGAKVRFGSEATVLKNTFTKDGYVFAGWVDKDGNKYDEYQKIDMLTSKLKLYATWKKLSSSYKVEYYYQKKDGTFNETADVTTDPITVTIKSEENWPKTVTVTPEEHVKRNFVNYTYIASDTRNCVSGSVSEDDNSLVLKVYYFRDKLGKQLIIQAKSDIKEYDGSALVNAGYDVYDTEGYAVEGITAKVEGSQTNVGKSDNIVTEITFDGTTYPVNREDGKISIDQDEYDKITIIDGTLEVTPIKLIVTAIDKEKIYGEKDPSFDPISSATAKREVKDADGNISYIDYSISKVAEVAVFTISREVGEDVLLDENGNVTTYKIDFTNTSLLNNNYSVKYIPAKFTIKPRPVTLRSGDKLDQEFTGKPVTYEYVYVKEGSFVGEENVNVKMSPDAYAIKPGEIKDNLFDVTSPVGKTKLTNYVITREYGKLSVKPLNGDEKIKITISVDAGPDGSDRKVEYYNGQIQTLDVIVTVDGNVYSTTKIIDGQPTVIDGIAEAIKEFVDNLKDFFVLKVSAADGKEITTSFTINGVTFTVGGINVYGGEGIDVDKYPVTLDTTGMTVVVNNIDVTDSFEVELEKAKPTVDPSKMQIGELEIIPRPVTLTSDSASKEYDGNPLTRPNVSVGGMGFIEGEVANVKANGSVTDPGSVKNNITFDKLENYKDKNYQISLSEGTLTVNPQRGDDNPPPPEDTPPTITPPADGQVLGAVRAVDGAAVLGARRGRTEDTANTLGRIITIIVAAGIGFTMIFIKRKKNEE